MLRILLLIREIYPAASLACSKHPLATFNLLSGRLLAVLFHSGWKSEGMY
jgi:hypothetical protein